MLTAGIDVGSSAVKVAVLDHPAEARPVIVTTALERYRRRTPESVVAATVDRALAAAGVAFDDLAYVATTGEGDLAPRRHGHFYGMTTHARGALHLEPRAMSVLDCGALHARAIRIDPRGRVLAYRMTSQCASGTGQFLENISRYLGVALEDVGKVSLTATSAEPVSGICAVLAETDVINMVSRGIPAPAILAGIHKAVAGRLAKLLRAARVQGPVAVTGGLAADEGLLASLRAELTSPSGTMEVLAPKEGVFAGAIGAAIWGAFRAERTGARPALISTEVSHAAL